MFEPIGDLEKARILVSNDDGIDSPGIRILEKVAKSLSKDVWVVAPASEQSAVAHSLTVRRPLRVIQQGRRRYAVDGTPTDSVLLGIRHILKDRRPDLVLSGVNRGANLGEDVTYSGTVAAAMEGTLLGVPSVAFSQMVNGEEAVRWSTAEHWAGDVLRKVTAIGWPGTVLINVNFPDLPHGQVTGIEIVRQGKRKLADEISMRTDPRGQPYFWIGAQRIEDHGTPGTDLDAIHRGAVAVTPLCVDFTSASAMKHLAAAFP